MQSADRIRALFRNSKLAVQADTDEQVFQDILRAHNESKGNEPVCASVDRAPGLWRITMRSPITKLAIAAAVIIACLAGVMMWKGTGASVALADVLARIEQVTAYRYQVSMTMTGQAPGTARPLNEQIHGTVLTAQGLGQKATLDTVDANNALSMRQEIFILTQKKALLTLIPAQKQYVQLELDDTMLKRVESQNNDPRYMIQQILDCNYVRLGRSTVDGVEVEGFETTDPRYLAGMMGQVDVKIWVDVKTQLPVRSEMDAAPMSIHMHCVVSDFEWNVSIDPSEMEPVIPADYTTPSGAPMKLPAMNEETAVDGLRRFAEMNGGRYPEQMDLMALSAKVGELTGKQVAEDAKNIGKEKAQKEMMGKAIPIFGAAGFYATLIKDNKDPAYYGKTVTPQDVDKVLMRWKMSDTEYRVIFGNLSAQTVKADVLAELEKATPK
jgi:outer membrane lipoprotein-sorting protein